MSDCKKSFGDQIFLAKTLLFYLIQFGIFYAKATECLILQPSGNREYQIPSDPSTISSSWIPSSFPTASALNISQKCLSDTQEYVEAFFAKRPWAITMYESSGRLVEELIHTGSGNVHHESGLFDECLSIRMDDLGFRGQYCTVFFDLKPTALNENDTGSNNLHVGEPYTYKSNFRMPSVGFCLPSTCSAKDLRSAVAQLVGYRIINGVNNALVTISSDDYCYSEDKINAKDIKSDALGFSVLLAFYLLGIIVLIATAHEVWRESYLQQPVVDSKFEMRSGMRFLHCFSAISNCRRMVSTQDDAKDSLSCLHGLRVLSTCVVVFQHTFLENIGRSSYNTPMLIKILASPINLSITVDNFFLMSGILVAYSQMRKLDHTQGTFNIWKFYLHRYFRLSSLGIVMLAFTAGLYSYVGSGPDWIYVEIVSEGARKYWWTILLYIQNSYVVYRENHLLNNPSTSIPESWYLACDMQMFWISPLFIYPLWRWKRAGLVWIITILIAFLGGNMMIFIFNDIPPLIVPSRPPDMAKFDEYGRLHYVQTYARIPPYLIGILLGWLLHKTKHKKLRMNKYLVALGWLTAAMLSWFVLTVLFFYLDEAQPSIFNQFFRVSYGALHRSVWALAIGWLIFACTRGYGGYVQSFLSWKFFVPLSRLSYAVYLIHPVYIKAYYSSMRKPLYSTKNSLFTTYFGILTMAFLIASVVSVIVEIPFLNLDKLLLPENSGTTNNLTPKNEENAEPLERKKNK